MLESPHMATVVFVHGTGVRKASYLDTFTLIHDAFSRHAIDHDLEPCLWGDSLGSRTPVKSVPGGVAQKPPDTDVARWDLLYRDPWLELRLLKNRPKLAGPVPPTAPKLGEALWMRIAAYEASPELARHLDALYLTRCWAKAITMARGDEAFKDGVTAARTEIGEAAQAAARCVVACLCLLAQMDGRPLPAAEPRSAVVRRLIEDWEGDVAGIGAYLAGFFSAATTPLVAWKRGDLSASAAGSAGDILLYQARGERIREHVRGVVESVRGDVYLLAHSLGGIACVDLLTKTPPRNVKGLITVGSQASFLYEIGGLSSVEPPDTIERPFPRWLNLWDRYDFLSYLAAPVFSGLDVTDTQVESGQPFPESHSAYWTNEETWHAIRSFLP